MIDVVRARLRAWREERRQGRLEKLAAAADTLEPGKDHDLLRLDQLGLVKARGSGQSITRIYAEIENLTPRQLPVVILPGTYFVSRGDYQNMVTREERRVTLEPASTARVVLAAACLNANLRIPGDEDRFQGVKRVSGDLARFLEATERLDPMTVQAGVWALTDKYSGPDVKRRLLSQDQHGSQRQAITDRNIEEAKLILARLGIDNRL